MHPASQKRQCGRWAGGTSKGDSLEEEKVHLM